MQFSGMHKILNSTLRKSELLRLIGSNSRRQAHTWIKEGDYKEITIPVPWGHISGKWWGSQDVQPMLAVHGVQDNAATFDRLAPLLKVKALLAIDVPGHGQSSHIPKGFFYHFMDAVCVLRFLIKDHFMWTQPVQLLGHSFGSTISYVYAATYSDQVSKYISIDCPRHHMAVSPNTIISSLRKIIDKTLDYEEKSTSPEYSYEELIELFYKGRKYRLSRESCEILLRRGTSRLDNGKVCLSRDVRLKLDACGCFNVDDLLHLAPKIKCDVLSIQAEKGVVSNNAKGDLYRKTVEDMVKNSAKSKHMILPGNHHVHLDNPELVANVINEFIAN